MDFLPYGRQTIDAEDIEAVLAVLQSDYLTQGPMVAAFEEAVAAYHDCRYAVSFSSGTAALHAAYYIATKFPFGKDGTILPDLHSFVQHPQSDYAEYERLKARYFEYITVPLSFAATANAGLYCGGKPVFVDVDAATLCMDVGKVEAAIGAHTRILTPVSYAGYPMDIAALRALPKVQEHRLCIIHDACHAIGARRDGHGIADFADMTILSFHPVKHVCAGEGGMVLTNERAYYEALCLFRSHGITKDASCFTAEAPGDWYYEMQGLGYNYRLTDLQSALGLSQLKKLDKSIARRNEIARRYDEAFSACPGVICPPGFLGDTSGDNVHSYHLYPIRVPAGQRKALFSHLRAEGIGVQVHYVPIDGHPYYGKTADALTSEICDTLISLPVFHSMIDEDVQRVVDVVTAYKKD